MKKTNGYRAMGGMMAALCFGAGAVMAQGTGDGAATGGGGGAGGGRNFDPAQFQQRMLDNMRENLELKDDARWVTVQPLVQKVLDLRREVGGMGMGRMGRGGGNRGGGQTATPGVSPAPSHPEADALQKAIEGNAPAQEVTAALEKYRQARKAREAELAAAQEELRKGLTPRQEAQAVLLGLLK